MSTYPNSIVSFATINNGDTTNASQINTPNAEIVAIETGLLNGFQHSILPDADNTRDAGTTAKNFRNIFTYKLSGTTTLDFFTNSIKALGIDSTQFVDSPTQPRASVFNSAVQTLTTGSITTLTFDSEDFDVGAMHSTSSNTSRLTVPTGGDGLYLISIAVNFVSNNSGSRIVYVKKNGSGAFTITKPSVGSGVVTSVESVFLMSLVATDYVEIQGQQDSGGNLDVTTATRFQIVKLW